MPGSKELCTVSPETGERDDTGLHDHILEGGNERAVLLATRARLIEEGGDPAVVEALLPLDE